MVDGLAVRSIHRPCADDTYPGTLAADARCWCYATGIGFYSHMRGLLLRSPSWISSVLSGGVYRVFALVFIVEQLFMVTVGVRYCLNIEVDTSRTER